MFQNELCHDEFDKYWHSIRDSLIREKMLAKEKKDNEYRNQEGQNTFKITHTYTLFVYFYLQLFATKPKVGAF